MAKRQLPSPEVLRQLLRYEPDTGKLFWKERGVEWFRGLNPERTRNAWNTMNAGEEAFTALTAGYRQGSLIGFHLMGHRVAWAIHHGAWPDQIDHVNGNRSDNRIVNLRNVSVAENNKNLGMRRNNTSGRTGVYWHKPSSRWVAHIVVDGRVTSLGSFIEREDAISARVKAERTYGYHPNHGGRIGYLGPHTGS